MMSGASRVYASIMELSTGMEETAEALSCPEALNPEYAKASKRREYVRFSKDYDIQIGWVNKDHMKIMDYINAVHSMVKNGSELEKIGKTLKGMEDFVVEHFASEERMFDKYKYPDTAAHKKIHTKLLGTVHDIVKKIEGKEEVNLIEVLKFLKSWLQGHIKSVDMKYSPYMREHGLT